MFIFVTAIPEGENTNERHTEAAVVIVLTFNLFIGSCGPCSYCVVIGRKNWICADLEGSGKLKQRCPTGTTLRLQRGSQYADAKAL